AAAALRPALRPEQPLSSRAPQRTPAASFQIGEKTANGTSHGFRDSFSFKCRGDRVFEIVTGSRWAGLSEIDDAIVNPAVINQGAGRIEHGGFGSDGHASALHQNFF